MGLGKTVQAIALLLHRKVSGPALVVAPTSVVDNWAAELARFAPSLSVALYRGSGRATVLADCPDVVLTSYGLMGRDVKNLSGVEWGTVVLDEAQAIANPASQRSKAARALPAGFRLALSGTPVQNRTSELWSLMAFALPGLLGERAHFQRHFIVPIEHLGDASRRALLARLVGPFVLRRTKDAVLTELPPRTEVLVPVTLSEAERDAYDKARAAAVVRLEQAGKRRSFQVLQELLRLRQRACHPKLVDPASTVPGSKLKQVVRTLVQLRAAGHQALVFSSFTSHLALVRHALDEQGFGVRYLDGATSVGRRAEEVAAFQAGDGDVFLISLKAGGTGLNLTAASYVLHIDPWWNPAAEDQASDRAHRMGQDKPVTVYRFVSAGTVEEQIVALHARKRELAEALLSAADSTRQLDAKELMALLQAASAPDSAPVEPVVPKKPVLRLVHDAATAPAPAPVTPQQPEPSELESAQALAERFRVWMVSEQAAGRIHTRRTVVSYCRAVDNLVTWAATLGHTSAQAVLDHADDYVALAKAGEGLSKSDKTVAKTAVRRLRGLVDRP
jgi:SNF2 family DNA or RNA helicase